jgi:tRNA (guanine37-N1)-methyltransferase
MNEPEAPPHLAFQFDVEIITLFPEIFDSFLQASLLGKAIQAGLIRVTRSNPRDFVLARYKSVDDAPYGGGPGMILKPEPISAAIDSAEKLRGRAHRIVLSPSGRLFDQSVAESLLKKGRILFICGRYEGIDERITTLYADDVLSIGDYVLAGGELPAAVILEAVARLIPGVLGCESSTVEESFSTGRLEYPQWTRPANFRGCEVPSILMSGNHSQVAKWRQLAALHRTRAYRPDLLIKYPPSDTENEFLGLPSVVTLKPKH